MSATIHRTPRSVSRYAVRRALAIAAISLFILAAPDSLCAQTPPAGAPPPAQPAGRGGGGNARNRGIRIMTLTSTAFTDGGMIPAKHAQTGRDVSPPLSWTGAPDSTQSFVLIMHDIDAAIGDGNDDLLHWMAWSIPGATTSLPEGVPQGPQVMGNMRQISGTGPYYRGPAAPSTGPAHHYMFELYALDINLNIAAVGMSPPATRAAVTAAMASHIRGKGVLMGLYKRPAP